MAKKRNPVFTTPAGRARYPWINKPNTRFDENGVYSVDLLMPADSKETQQLMEDIDDMIEAKYNQTIGELQENGKGGMAKQLKKADPPYQMELDEDGNETGQVKFKFKNDASFTSKKTNETFTFKPGIFNVKGALEDISVFGGSLIKVGWEPNPYYVPATKLCGISLRLKAVQVIEAAQGGAGNRDASFYGFKNESSALPETDSDDTDEGSDDDGPAF